MTKPKYEPGQWVTSKFATTFQHYPIGKVLKVASVEEGRVQYVVQYPDWDGHPATMGSGEISAEMRGSHRDYPFLNFPWAVLSNDETSLVPLTEEEVGSFRYAWEDYEKRHAIRLKIAERLAKRLYGAEGDLLAHIRLEDRPNIYRREITSLPWEELPETYKAFLISIALDGLNVIPELDVPKLEGDDDDD